MIDNKTIEKLKYIVIYKHISALLLCAICYPVVFWLDSNLYVAIPLFVVTTVASGYSFIRQTVFLFLNSIFQKKNRTISEIILYSGCICFAIIIGIVSITCNIKSWGRAIFLSLKIYYLLFTTVAMAIMMSSAHRLSLILAKETKGDEFTFNDFDGNLKFNYLAIVATLLSSMASITVQFVGVGNVLYYFLCLPFLLVALLLFIIYFFKSIKGRAVNRINLLNVVAVILVIFAIVISHIFSNACIFVGTDSLNVDFEIYTFVMIPVLIFHLIALIIFKKINHK